MALLFMDSFDHYLTADILLKWTAMETGGIATITAGAGRRGSAAVVVSSGAWWLRRSFAATATAIVGLAIKPASLGGLPVALIEGAGPGVAVRINADGSLSACRMSSWASVDVVLGTTAVGLISAGAFNYVEAKVTIHDTAGVFVLRVNGVSALSLTGVDTRYGGTGVMDTLYLQTYGGGGAITVDDLYLLDGSGSAPWNDCLGDCRVDYRAPTGAGNSTQWTPSAGANYAAVDDAMPNGDTDYTASSTLNQIDTFALQDAPVSGATIYGVQTILNAKKMDTGACSIAPVIRHSGTDYVGTNVNPATSYGYFLQPYQTNPGTSAQWTESGFNAAEIGYKKTA